MFTTVPMRSLMAAILLGCSCQLATAKPRASRVLLDGDSNFEYVATTDVSFLLNLALDAAEMRKSDTDIDTKSEIYYKGKNAFYQEEDGKQTVISLAGLSLASSGVMSGDPLYNIYRNAFYDLGIENENDEAGNFDGHPVEEYANTLVVDLFELNSTRTETEGAIVLNVWMAVAHELHSVLRGCQSNNQDEMNGALDRATALWIGADQIRGDNLEGHLLYNLAELAGELFGQDDGESKVNTEIMKKINDIQFNIASGTCGQNGGYVEMRDMIRRVTALMTVPLVQTLMHHIVQIENEGASDMVELYALALLPRVAACEPNKYKTMLNWMVFNSLTIDNQLDAIENVQSILSCLGVTCADVGSYLNGKVPQCNDDIVSQASPPALASYQPTVDVRDKSYIDRDMLQFQLLMEWEAYDAAKDYYLYGANSKYSLSELATNKAGATDSNLYDTFTQYYESQNLPNAHAIVMDILDGVIPFDDKASDDQKTQAAMSVLRSVVMYVAAISEFESAVAECESASSNAMQFWDGGAAYFIGSVEGTSAGGVKKEGQLLYGAAKQLCDPFGTCEPDDAAINKVILQGLNFGKTSLQNGNCAAAKQILHDTIEPSMLIPLVQGTLFYADKAKTLLTGIDSGDFASMFGYSRGVLPFVQQTMPASASVVQKNTQFQLASKPLPDGFDAVFASFRDALQQMATDCKAVGRLASIGGLCVNDDGSSPSTGSTTSTTVPAPVPAPDNTPTNIADIAFGRYTFSSMDAPNLDSRLSLDVRDIRETNDVKNAERTYVQGRNVQEGLYGQVSLMSLSEVSSQAHLFMNDDPIFNFFRYALYDESTFESSSSNASWPFADMVVRLALSPDHGNDAELASEASVIMNVFFLIQHRLYRAARECRQGLNPAHLIDSAVALWIGQEQQEGKFGSGYMMYSLAQGAAQAYGLPEEEAPVNKDLMDMFKEAQVLAEFCPSQQNSFLEMRVLSSRIIQKFSVILVQRLMYFMAEDNLDHTELYALSVIPQAVSCDSGVYQELKGALIDSFSRDATIDDRFYTHMGKLLKCMRVTCGDLGDTSKGSSHLQDIVSNVCQKLDEDDRKTALAGYNPTFTVTEESQIDLDIRQIGLFMKTRAYEAASEYYMYGGNSLKTDRSFLSLQYLATAPERSVAGAEFSRFTAYFGNDNNYADTGIMTALRQEGIYERASRLQLSEAVERQLQTMVSYMAVHWMLSSAIDACQSGQESQEYLDTAVAYYVGSMEGADGGGVFGGYGVLLFGLAKEQCLHFDTCTSSGDAMVNQKIMQAFSNMQSRLSSNDCTSAASSYNNDIMDSIPVPLIQGTLYYASVNEKLDARSTSRSIADASVLAASVLPKVNAANPSSASTIQKNMAFNLDQRPVADGIHAVFNAFAQAINSMGIDCNDVAVLRPESRGVCKVSDESDRPAPDTPTNLGNDLYVATTYVQDRANIAIDVKEMEDALKDGREDFAKLIYAEGKNSEIYDDNGMTVDHRSVAAFSLTEAEKMVNEPLFNMFVYALQDSSGQFMGRNAKLYADSIVQDSFNVKNVESKTLAAEAAVALNIWMYLAHTLYHTLDECKNGLLASDGGIHAIDEAVAYWIGDGQVTGSAGRGHLLYALAEEMGEEFQMDEVGQVRTNTNILRLFHQAKIELSLPDACADPGTYKKLYHVVNKIISQMAIPLIQGLIHNLRRNDAERVKLYAYATVPLFASCNTADFSYLRSKLIYSSYNIVEVEPIIDRILKSLPCLGLQCADIGVHVSEIESSCNDPPVLTSLAGYKPASDVREYAQLDLDIREIDILMRMGAFEAAEDLYTNGKHTMIDGEATNGVSSLSFLATTTARSVVPQYDSFVRYFDGNEKYADAIVRDALTNSDYSNETRRLLVTRTCQYMIMFMAALQGMHEAIGECEATSAARDTTAAVFWDRAAASIIGHMEGSTNGGDEGGMLFFGLAKQHCEEFDTCSSKSPLTAEVNDKITSLLYAGRGAVLGRSCSEIRKATAELEPLLLVPLIQATLSASERAMNTGIKQKALSADQVEAYIFANAVLPLLDDIDRVSADTIKRNLDLASTPAHGALGAIVEGFFLNYEALGLHCKQVGWSDDVDACNGTYEEPMSTGTITGIAVGCFIGLLTLVGIFWLLRLKRKEGKDASEDDPVFVASKGELNHTEDLLTKSEAQSTISQIVEGGSEEIPMVKSEDQEVV